MSTSNKILTIFLSNVTLKENWRQAMESGGISTHSVTFCAILSGSSQKLTAIMYGTPNIRPISTSRCSPKRKMRFRVVHLYEGLNIAFTLPVRDLACCFLSTISWKWKWTWKWKWLICNQIQWERNRTPCLISSFLWCYDLLIFHPCFKPWLSLPLRPFRIFWPFLKLAVFSLHSWDIEEFRRSGTV